MRRLFLALLSFALLEIAVVWSLHDRYTLARSELIDIAGYSILVFSIVLLYYQIKGNIIFERRRTTHDFIHGPVHQALLPLEKQMKDLLNPRMVLFPPNDTYKLTIQQYPSLEGQLRPIALGMLNFYERAAISLRMGILDEDMLYDDKGAIAIGFHRWVNPLLRDLRTGDEPRAFTNFSALIANWSRRYQEEAKRNSKKESYYIEGFALRRRGLFS